jgi:hypothetical protein
MVSTTGEDFVYSKFGTIIAVAIAIFPFALVLAKLAETEGTLTVVIVAAIFVIFFATVLLATRVTLEPEPELAEALRAPAPPIAWSWDGVNRQPEGGDGAATTTESHH